MPNFAVAPSIQTHVHGLLLKLLDHVLSPVVIHYEVLGYVFLTAIFEIAGLFDNWRAPRQTWHWFSYEESIFSNT
jgi:hypothetical protein